MKNKFIKLICLLLCLALALSAFAGCKGQNTGKKNKKNKKTPSVSSELSSDLSSDTSSDEWIDDEPDDQFEEDEPIDEEPIDEGDPDTVAIATVSNAAPLTQNVMGAGMGLYCPYTFMDNEIVPDDDVAYAEFDRLKYMGIHTVRGMFKFQWLDEGRNDGVWNWESYKMQAYYKWMQAMKDRDISVFVNPWSFAHIANLEDYRYWDTKCFYADTFEKTIENWANAMTEVMLKLKAKGFTNANGLLLFTEPNYAADVEAHPELNDQYIYTAKLIDKKLKAAGIRQSIRLMGPNYAATDTVLLEKCMKEAYDCFDIFSQHRYVKLPETTSDLLPDIAAGEYSGFVETAKSLNTKQKPFWIDEYNASLKMNEYGVSNLGYDDIYIGIQRTWLYNYLINLGGVNGAMIWTIADQQWPESRGDNLQAGFYKGVLMHGMLPNLMKSMVPKSQYYAFSLLSKYTGRSGNKVYYSETENMSVSVSATQLADGNWTFVVTNTNVDKTLFKLEFEKQLNGLKLYRHQYVASEVKPTNAGKIIPANKTILNVKTGFTDVLKPYSVAVYTTVKG